MLRFCESILIIPKTFGKIFWGLTRQGNLKDNVTTSDCDLKLKALRLCSRITVQSNAAGPPLSNTNTHTNNHKFWTRLVKGYVVWRYNGPVIFEELFSCTESLSEISRLKFFRSQLKIYCQFQQTLGSGSWPEKKTLLNMGLNWF